MKGCFRQKQIKIQSNTNYSVSATMRNGIKHVLVGTWHHWFTLSTILTKISSTYINIVNKKKHWDIICQYHPSLVCRWGRSSQAFFSKSVLFCSWTSNVHFRSRHHFFPVLYSTRFWRFALKDFSVLGLLPDQWRIEPQKTRWILILQIFSLMTSNWFKN